MVLTVVDWEVSGLGSTMAVVGGVVVLVVCGTAVDVFIVDGVNVFGWEVETFPGAGAVFRALSTEVDIFPGGEGETVLDRFWEGVGFLPEIGAGAVLVKLGLVVVVILLETLAVEGIIFLGCTKGGLGGPGCILLTLLALKVFDIFVVVEVVAVVVIVAAVVGLAVVVASSASGLTTTKEVTGVTKLYFRERLVALSANNLCMAGSVVFSLARRSSLIVK